MPNSKSPAPMSVEEAVRQLNDALDPPGVRRRILRSEDLEAIKVLLRVVSDSHLLDTGDEETRDALPPLDSAIEACRNAADFLRDQDFDDGVPREDRAQFILDAIADNLPSLYKASPVPSTGDEVIRHVANVLQDSKPLDPESECILRGNLSDLYDSVPVPDTEKVKTEPLPSINWGDVAEALASIRADHDWAHTVLSSLVDDYLKVRSTLVDEIVELRKDKGILDYLVSHTYITESYIPGPRAPSEPIAQMDESGPRLPNGNGDLRGAVIAALQAGGKGGE